MNTHSALKRDDKLIIKCSRCNTNYIITVGSYYKRKTDICTKCLYADPNFKEQFRKLHDNPEYCARVYSKASRLKLSEATKNAWKDPQKRESHMRHRRTEEFKKAVSERSKKKWQEKEYIQKQLSLRRSYQWHITSSKAAKKLWADSNYRNRIISKWNDPNFRSRIIKILDEYRSKSVFNGGKISKLQKMLYVILDDLGVIYHKEGNNTVAKFIDKGSRLRSFIFDCLVEYNNKKLYIECYDNYYHSKLHKIIRDAFKAEYLNRHGGKDTELLALWENEFVDFDKIREMIAFKLGIADLPSIDFDIKDIKICDGDLNDLRMFFGRYHYLANLGRPNMKYLFAGKFNNQTVVAAAFTNPTRDETATRLGFLQNQILELTRFCIHPQYHKKNLASWFLSRVVKIIKSKSLEVMGLIAFSDLTHGHEGTIYKASNWKLDGVVDPDYWYIDVNGMPYHKKSIWNRARLAELSEIEYAKQNGLTKVFGREKHRYLYLF